MSLQSALFFIAAVREDDSLRRRIAAHRVDGSLSAIVTIARSAGFAFETDELRRGFLHDWSMRWVLRDQRRVQE